MDDEERRADRHSALPPAAGRAAAEPLLSFESSSLPQAVVDLDGRVVAANLAWTTMFGRSQDSLLGRDVASVLHPLGVPDTHGHLAPLRRGEADSATFEVVARRGDGRSLQLLVDAAVVRDDDGTPRSVVLLAHDLTAVRSAQERLDRQERLYRALSQRASDAALVTDADLTVTYASPAVAEMLGHDPFEVVSTVASELFHPEEQQSVARVVAAVVAESGGTRRCVARARTASGGWRWVELTAINCLSDPDVGGLILSLRDVTSEREAQEAMRESEARYRAVVETAQEGIIATDPDGGIVLANDRIVEILGLTTEEIRRSGTVQRLLAGDSWTRPAVETGAGRAVRTEVGYAHPDGAERILSVSSSPLPAASASDASSLVMVSDVTDSRRLQERLQHQALHDQLTGLPNRYLFADRLELAAARQQRHQTGSTAVMFLDLDGFKAINDTHGHAAGDLLLQEIARRLLLTVRAADTAARLGGDEFAIICEEMDEDAARAVAARIQGEVFAPLELDGHQVEVTGSIGIALFPPHDPARALSLADTAMYQAKRLGGGGVILFGAQ